MPTKDRPFYFPWENSSKPKATFKTSITSLPIPEYERINIAKLMTVKEILSTTEFDENVTMKRKRRWKEIRQLYLITQQKEYCHGSIENALWFYGSSTVTLLVFITALTAEFNFDQTQHIDKHLRWLYWSFDGGSTDTVDWREILIALKVVVLFRLIRNRTKDLLVMLFDVFAYTKSDSKLGLRGSPDQFWYVANPQVTLLKLFTCVCESDYDCKTVEDMLQNTIINYFNSSTSNDDITNKMAVLQIGKQRIMDKNSKNSSSSSGSSNSIKHADNNEGIPSKVFRKDFIAMLDMEPKLVMYWERLAWSRLPTDLRLLGYDEAQSSAQYHMDRITVRFKYEQAMYFHHKITYRKFFKDWIISNMKETRLNKYLLKKLYKSFKKYFRFWRWDAACRHTKRQRKLLAEVMGCYSMKARVFSRIKLFNYTTKKVVSTVGNFNRHLKQFKEGGAHIRRYQLLACLRKYYHNWWNNVALIINYEVSARLNWEWICGRVFSAWCKWSLFEAHNKRMELLVMENKASFDKRMADVDKQVEELMQLESAKQEKEKEEERTKSEMDRVKRLEVAKQRAQAEKSHEKRVLLDVQRDARRRRVEKQMKKMKKDFKKKWVKRRQSMLDTAKKRLNEYFQQKENKIAITMRFEKLKREFYAPPSKDNIDREKVLTNPKNIVFLYLDAKLQEYQLKMKDIISKFDVDSRGYLFYPEFAKMIKSLGVKLNPVQLNDVIKGVDTDGDGFIEVDELTESMKDTILMGVRGSDWKMYVDPAQNVICYHNFKSNEKVFEYQMTDEKLMEISQADAYGEAWFEANRLADEKKEEDWDKTMKNYMVKRLQGMLRRWKAGKKRHKKVLKIYNKEITTKMVYKKVIAKFIDTYYHGYQVRRIFKCQLHYTYEKVWDTASCKCFWYNHQTKISVWDRPLLLWRYGDVPTPSPWVVATDSVSGQSGYWHSAAKRFLPRKPDGIQLCHYCNSNISLLRCLKCETNYCFTCLRDTHGNPYQFLQKPKVTRSESVNDTFISKLDFFQNHLQYTEVSVIKCQSCKSEKINAAFHCNDCNQNICRPCSRRIHAHSEFKCHIMYEV